jgi:hypothetical protein
LHPEVLGPLNLLFQYNLCRAQENKDFRKCLPSETKAQTREFALVPRGNNPLLPKFVLELDQTPEQEQLRRRRRRRGKRVRQHTIGELKE